MKKIIHRLRQQPEAIRTHILHVLTLVAGFILILLWIYSLGKNLSSSDTRAKIDNDLKPLSALKENIVNGYKSITSADLDRALDAQ